MSNIMVVAENNSLYNDYIDFLREEERSWYNECELLKRDALEAYGEESFELMADDIESSYHNAVSELIVKSIERNCGLTDLCNIFGFENVTENLYEFFNTEELDEDGFEIYDTNAYEALVSELKQALGI